MIRALVERRGVPVALYTNRHAMFKHTPGSGFRSASTQFLLHHVTGLYHALRDGRTEPVLGCAVKAPSTLGIRLWRTQFPVGHVRHWIG